MRLLHLKGKHIDKYIVIDKIESFSILKIENSLNYTVDIFANSRPTPLALKTNKPQEIVKDLIRTINTIDNEIIEYTVKESEWYKWQKENIKNNYIAE